LQKDPFSFWEWLFVGLVAGCLVTISLFSLVNSPSFCPEWVAPQKIEVTVTGAVKNPGTYEVYANTLFKKILAKVKPLKSADLSKIKSIRRVERSCEVDIPFKENIQVFVTGAVDNPGRFILPYGSNKKNLLGKLKLKKNANCTKMRKNKILKDQEEIIIPWA